MQKLRPFTLLASLLILNVVLTSSAGIENDQESFLETEQLFPAGTIPINAFHAAQSYGWKMALGLCKTLQGFNFDGPSFFAYLDPYPGTVPLYEYTATIFDGLSYRYATDTNVKNTDSQQWKLGNIMGFVFPTQASGTRPFYQVTATNPDGTTRYFLDPVNGGNGWAPGPIVFYAY